MKGCDLLSWDSTFFGKQVARLSIEHPTATDLKEAMYWAEKQSIDCMYLLVPFQNAASIRLATEYGFQIVDLRLTLERNVTETPMPPQVRLASDADRPALRAIASGSFLHTRFNRDPRFAPRANFLYETWVERALDGFADAVLISLDMNDAPEGFVCCHRHGAERGELGLTAVRSDQRRKGVGSTLVTAARAWFHAQRLSSAIVVTNGANLAAQRLYQRHGFVSDQVHVWFHRWFTQPEVQPHQ